MLKRGLVGGFLASAAIMLVPSVAGAQDVRDLDQEASNVRHYTGSLGAEPSVFAVSIPATSALRIDVISTSELDPMVSVFDAATGALLIEDDDSGDELNARVTVRGEQASRVRIEVSRFAYDGMEEGGNQERSFDLRLTTMAHNPQSLRPVTWGSALGGTLMGEDRHEFSFAGEAGQLLEVALLGSADSGVDPYLELRDETGEMIASNDDSGGSLNALLRHVMQTSGTYTIVARDFRATGGDYTLRVGERRELVVQAPIQVIGLGDTATGSLGEGYENGGLEPAQIDYQLSEAAISTIMAGGGAVTIRMNAVGVGHTDFGGSLDPVVELGFDTPLGFAVADRDDDGSGTSNAMLPVDLSSLAANRDLLARLRVRAMSFSGSIGGYTLTITQGIEASPVYEETTYAPMVVPSIQTLPRARAYD